MSRSVVETCTSLVDRHLPGEHIEVFARRVRTTAVRDEGEAAVQIRSGEGWLVGVHSRKGESQGSATGNCLDGPELDALLTSARQARAAAPQPAVPLGGTAASQDGEVDFGEPESASIVDRLTALTRSVHDEVAGSVAVTGGYTRRTVLRVDSSGWFGCYEQSEAQLHARSGVAGLEAAQSARIRRSIEELSAHEVGADYRRSLTSLSLPAHAPGAVDWIVLSPLLVARVLSRVSQAFVRPLNGRTALETRTVLYDGANGLTLVDDGTVPAGPGGAPFDDEGTPRRRTVLLEQGTVTGMLGSLAAGPTTGNAAWTDWDRAVAPAAACSFLLPTDADRPVGQEAPVPAGRGLVAEELRGFRGGLDLTARTIEFEVTGAVVRDGAPLGTGRLNISASPGDFLGAIRRVCPGTEFYRIQGLHGGSWCVLDGKVAHHGA